MANSTFPGMEEVLRFLEQQRADEIAKTNAKMTPIQQWTGAGMEAAAQKEAAQQASQAAATAKGPQSYSSPYKTNVADGVPSMATGGYPAAEGPFKLSPPQAPVQSTGQRALGALKSVGKEVGKQAGVARNATGIGPWLGFGLASNAAVNKGWQWGNEMGQGYYDKEMANEYTKPRPTAGKSAQVVAQQPSATQHQSDTYIPDELVAMMSSGDDQVNPLDEQQSYVAPERTPPEMPVPATEDIGGEDDPGVGPEQEAGNFMKQIMATLEPQQPVQEQPYSESESAIQDLTKTRVDTPQAEPTSRMGKFGRGLSKFLVAGAGPYDPTRYERQQLELRDKKREFSPQEKLRGELAVADRQGSDQFNRAAQLKQMDASGDAQRAKATVMSKEQDYTRGRADKATDSALEHSRKLTEIGAGGAATRNAPDTLKTQGRIDFANKSAFAVPDEEFQALFGYSLSPEAKKVLEAGFLKNDPMAMAVSEMLQARLANMRQPTGGAKAAPNLVTKSLSQPAPKKDKVSDKSLSDLVTGR